MEINHYKWDLKRARIVIGLTGSVASGKSSVANLFAALGAKVLDADALALKQLDKGKPAYKKVLKKLGRKVLNSDKTINRKKLAEEVFSDLRLRKWLENIIHPYVLQEFKSAIEKTGNRIIICDIPLLFERGLEDWFNLTVCVYADSRTCLKRVKKRQWDKAEFSARMKAQLPLKTKMRKADINIENSGTISQLSKKVEKLYKTIKMLKKD